MNWGPDNRDDATINVCNNANIEFLPTLWGQTWDDSELSALPNSTVPWGVFLENEPNWFGAYSSDHGVGCNLTAEQCATRYYVETGKFFANESFFGSPSDPKLLPRHHQRKVGCRCGQVVYPEPRESHLPELHVRARVRLCLRESNQLA